MPDNLMNKCRKNVKNFKYRTIPKISHQTFCTYEEKQYWKQVIYEFEKKYRRKIDTIKFSDFTTIPSELYERISKLIQITPIKDDSFEDLIDEDELRIDELKTNLNNRYKSMNYMKRKVLTTNSSIQQNVLITKRKLRKSDKNQNWIKNYAFLKEKERIKWNTKYYDLEKDKQNRPLIEKAEEVMNQAAKQFSEFVNSLGPDKTANISEEAIKSLFVINLENTTESNRTNDDVNFSLVNIPSEELLNISEELSKSFSENPEFIEFQKMKEDYKKRKQKQKIKKPKIAFGRTMKTDDEKFLPLKITDQAHSETYFPEELRTGEIIFSGICNLRVTKDLIKYYLENENLKRPEYLIKNGYFNQQTDTSKRRPSIIPFYELIKN